MRTFAESFDNFSDYLNGVRGKKNMRTVKVEVKSLLEKLEENRKNHRDVFEKALLGYRAAAIAELEKMLTEARAGKRIRRDVRLVEPVDQTKDYDRVIGMFKMHTEPTIEITEHEYQMYVMDDWSWKDQFTTINSNYVHG